MPAPAGTQARPPPPLPGMRGVPDLAAVRLAVCPCCRTVWDLDPIFPESVKLMICWRCAEQHAHLGATAPAPALASPHAESRPDLRRTLWVGFAAVATLGLAALTVVRPPWSDRAARTPHAAGSVTMATTGPGASAATDTAAAEAVAQALAMAERVLAAPADGAASAVVMAKEAPSSGQPATRASVRPKRTAADAPAPKVERGSAAPPSATPAPAACTSGAAALGLCSAPSVNVNERPDS